MKRKKGSTVRKNNKKEWKIGHLLKCTRGNEVKQEKSKNELMKNYEKMESKIKE